MTIHYLLAGNLLAASPAPGRRSFAYFCSTCGEIWGRVWAVGVDEWDVETVACEEHRPQGVIDWSRVPGSFLSRQFRSAYSPRSHQAISVEHLPPAVLRRELELHILNVERKAAQIDD